MHGFTDLQTQFCWKLIYMYVIRWCMSEIIDLTKNSISNCNLRQHAIFCKYIYEHCFDWSTTYIMSIIASNWQHCDQQQFRTLSCVHAFLLRKKLRVRLAYILFIVSFVRGRRILLHYRTQLSFPFHRITKTICDPWQFIGICYFNVILMGNMLPTNVKIKILKGKFNIFSFINSIPMLLFQCIVKHILIFIWKFAFSDDSGCNFT